MYAGEPGEPQPDLKEHTPDVTVQLPNGIAVHESASVGVASKSGGKDFAKAKLVVAGPDGPESKEVRGRARHAIPRPLMWLLCGSKVMAACAGVWFVPCHDARRTNHGIKCLLP